MQQASSGGRPPRPNQASDSWATLVSPGTPLGQKLRTLTRLGRRRRRHTKAGSAPGTTCAGGLSRMPEVPCFGGSPRLKDTLGPT